MKVSMATAKTEMVSVRVEPDIKKALQLAAAQEMRSVSNMLEVMVVAYCRQHGYEASLPKETAEGSHVRAASNG